MKRKIINIDEDKCNGCGLCVPDCAEGALQIIDGKVRLISDLFCDGLGACVGTCPENAIEVIEREAEPYDERKVIDNMIDKPNVLKAHLEHLKAHGAKDFLHEAFAYLEDKGIPIPIERGHKHHTHNHGGSEPCGCPSLKIIDRSESVPKANSSNQAQESELRQWPVQLHLVPPTAPFFKDKEIVLLSTCSPIASAEVHQKYIKNRAVIMACPKLDRTEPYLDKLTGILSQSGTSRLIVVIMEVPCCNGLGQLAAKAAALSGRDNLIVEQHVMSLEGKIKSVEILYHS